MAEPRRASAAILRQGKALDDSSLAKISKRVQHPVGSKIQPNIGERVVGRPWLPDRFRNRDGCVRSAVVGLATDTSFGALDICLQETTNASQNAPSMTRGFGFGRAILHVRYFASPYLIYLGYYWG